jgi:hypothetical protein
VRKAQCEKSRNAQNANCGSAWPVNLVLTVGLALLMVSCSTSKGENTDSRVATPTRETQAKQEASKAEADLLRFDVELRGHLVTLGRLRGEATAIADKSDAILDSGDCNALNPVASLSLPQLDRIINQMQKENAWLVANKQDPRIAGLPSIDPELPAALIQSAAEGTAMRERLSELVRRASAAASACGFAK